MPLLGNGQVEMLIGNGTAPYTPTVVAGWRGFRMEIQNDNTVLFFNEDGVGVGSGDITVRISDSAGHWAEVVVSVTVTEPPSSSSSSSMP